VVFPEGLDTSNWDVASIPRLAEVSKAGNTITWSASYNLDNGFEVGADIPKDALNITKPDWQDEFDRQNPDQSGNAGSIVGSQSSGSGPRSLADLGILVFSVVLLLGGIMWRLTSWYTRGRDKAVRLPIDYLADPPSDLPPGLVGTLLDESADVRDVIATIADLGRKGNLTIAETGNNGVRDYTYTQTGNKTQYRYEEMVMLALFGGGKQTTNLSNLKSDFQNALPPVYDEMYKNLVVLKYFPESPDAVRKRASRGCGWMVFVGLLVGGAGLFFGAQLSYMLVVLGVVLGILAIVRIFTSSAMPRKTDFGAEETEKWQAFKRYLQQIQRYTNVQEATDRFQKYLPYAVAMGIDKEFTSQFNSVPSATPSWYVPYIYPSIINDTLSPGYGSGPVGSFTGGGVSGPAPNLDPGAAMQGMSDSLSGAMQGLSDSFTGMVNSAASVFTGGSSGAGSPGGSGGRSGGSSGGGSSAVGDIAGSVGGLLVSVAISAVFGGGGGGGGGGGAD
jgi:hypothetical protein